MSVYLEKHTMSMDTRTCRLSLTLAGDPKELTEVAQNIEEIIQFWENRNKYLAKEFENKPKNTLDSLRDRVSDFRLVV